MFRVSLVDRCKKLYLAYNAINDEGMRALAAALRVGKYVPMRLQTRVFSPCAAERPAFESLSSTGRLNVLSFKLQRARSYLSLHSFRIAQHYLLSTWHDMRAMRGVLEESSAELRASLVCE